MNLQRIQLFFTQSFPRTSAWNDTWCALPSAGGWQRVGARAAWRGVSNHCFSVASSDRRQGLTWGRPKACPRHLPSVVSSSMSTAKRGSVGEKLTPIWQGEGCAYFDRWHQRLLPTRPICHIWIVAPLPLACLMPPRLADMASATTGDIMPSCMPILHKASVSSLGNTARCFRRFLHRRFRHSIFWHQKFCVLGCVVSWNWVARWPTPCAREGDLAWFVACVAHCSTQTTSCPNNTGCCRQGGGACTPGHSANWAE